MGEGIEVAVTSLASEPLETGDTGVRRGELAHLRELELSGAADEDSDVGVRALLEGGVLSVLRSGEDVDEEDGGGTTLLGGLAGSLDTVGEATFGVPVQEGHQGTPGEEEGENCEGGELVSVVHD